MHNLVLGGTQHEKLTLLTLSALVIGGISLTTGAQANSDSAAATATAEIVVPLEIEEITGIDFGKILTAGATDTGGTATTAGVLSNSAHSQFTGSNPHGATLKVSAFNGQPVTMTTLPTSVTLNRTAGGASMTAALTYSTDASGSTAALTSGSTVTTPAANTFDVDVAGTLTIAAAQLPGVYNGTYNVQVDY